MCFRPGNVKKREVACPECKKMNPLPLSIDSTVADIMNNEDGKVILEKNCLALVSDPQFKMGMRMTLKQIKPMSRGKVTQAMIESVSNDLAELPVKKECKFCGGSLP